MKKKRVVRSAMYLDSVLFHVEDKTYVFRVCDRVILFSKYLTKNLWADPYPSQPIKIKDNKSIRYSSKNWFNYYARFVSQKQERGWATFTSVSKIMIEEQYPIKKGFEVTREYLAKLLTQIILSEETNQ